MPKYMYSPSRNLFYDADLERGYSDSGIWPSDAIEVSETTFLSYTGLPPEGKRRLSDNDGLPCWGDLPGLTQQEQVAIAEAQRQELINQANDYINRKQWPYKLALNRLSENEKRAFNIWIDYLDALGDIDTSLSPDINWPVPPND
ncbi:tail fiber assembly protein [Kosakonia sacchari]